MSHSLYHVNEEAPSDEDFKNLYNAHLALTQKQPDKMKRMRRYVEQWTCWLQLGLTMIKELETSVQALLPSLFSHWSTGALTVMSGVSR